MTDTKFYKVLNLDGTSCNGGHGQWSLPHDGLPGAWMPEIKKLVPCESGYHVCERGQLVRWLGPAIHPVEVRGEMIRQDDKCVVSEARIWPKLDTWNDRSARLFACDCADEALKLVKEPDSRSIEAVHVARLYAVGESTNEQLDAARASARAAARDAAGAAARASAWAAARDAAWDAAWAAARAWQTEKLFWYLEGEK